jgi:hypothetical protein
MITYGKCNNGITVKLDGVRVGTIRSVPNGWQYWTRTAFGGTATRGEVFSTVNECKRSLEHG